MNGDKPILVVGAGTTGTSTAYHLAKEGNRVVLIDRGQIASGTTSRSTALVRTHYSNEIVAKMALFSLRQFESLPETGFVNNGVFFIASDAEKGAISANVSMLERIGVRSMVLDREDSKRKFPELMIDDCSYFLLEPESGYADPVATAVYYAKKAEESGAEIITGKRVAKVLFSNKKLEGVELSDWSRIRCEKAILCTNVWTNQLLKDSGFNDTALPLWTSAHPVITMKRPQSYAGKKATIVDLPSKAYFKPEGQSLLFGGSLDAEMDRDRVINPEQCPNEIPFEFLSYYSEAIMRRIPGMAQGEVHSSYVGMYDMTPDQHPIIDSLDELLGAEGLYCCVGLSGHGFKLCPALGVMNSEMVMGREPSMFDWNDFSLRRFREGKVLTTKFSGIGTIA